MILVLLLELIKLWNKARVKNTKKNALASKIGFKEFVHGCDRRLSFELSRRGRHCTSKKTRKHGINITFDSLAYTLAELQEQIHYNTHTFPLTQHTDDES